MEPSDLIEPSLKFLDAQKCHDIFESLKSAEAAQGHAGVFQTDLWKEYHKRFLPDSQDAFEMFKFDEQLTNMYRAGFEGLYVRTDYNKFSTQKLDEYYDFQENVALKHPGYEVSRNDGKVEVPKKTPLLEEVK